MSKNIFSYTSGLFALLFAATTFFLFSFSSDASAQSRVCRQLERDLASVSGSQRGTSPQYRKFDNAVRDQTVQLNRTEKLLRRNRCGLGGIFRKKGAQCRQIRNSLRRMEANLRSLKNQRARYAPQQAGNSRARNRIIQQMQRNRCDGYSNGQQQAEAPRKSRRRTLLEQIFGVRTYDERGDQIGEEFGNSEGYGNTYRTLCVRKSDGYYFPISFSTRQEFFERDDQTCQAMCPSADVGLFHHRMPGQDSEQMVEYGTEQAYATMPFAFAYRKTLDTNNSCRFAKTETINTANYDQNGEVDLNSDQTVQNIGIPVFRKDQHLIPDDYDNKVANFSLEIAKKYLENARNPQNGGTLVDSQKDKNIRIVGPAFFPVQ